jgi:hypothetical protein
VALVDRGMVKLTEVRDETETKLYIVDSENF